MMMLLPLRSDYRRTVSLSYVLRGFDKVFQLGIPLVAIAAAGLGALELLNLWNQGELHKLFAELQFLDKL